MGTVLLWILGILLGIILLALVIVLVLLNVRAGIEAVGVTGEVSVEARYGPVRIPLYPRPRHLKKKKRKRKRSKRNPRKVRRKRAASPVSRCRRTDWMSVRSQARCAISSAT